jgi:hypothetical protein
VSQACIAAVYLRGHMDQESLVFSSFASSEPGACRVTALERFGVVQAAGKRATPATRPREDRVADGRGHAGPWQEAPSVARPMFPDLGSGKARRLACLPRGGRQCRSLPLRPARVHGVGEAGEGKFHSGSCDVALSCSTSSTEDALQNARSSPSCQSLDPSSSFSRQPHEGRARA